MKNKNGMLIGAGALAAIAATLLFWRKNKNKQSEHPPKHAPQLPIENPGIQSDFPTAPTPNDAGIG
jgi:LPXTG-motif cell wall-anchored protein